MSEDTRVLEALADLVRATDDARTLESLADHVRTRTLNAMFGHYVRMTLADGTTALVRTASTE